MVKGKQYDEDLKKMIVELYNTKTKKVCEIIREYGISSSVEIIHQLKLKMVL